MAQPGITSYTREELPFVKQLAMVRKVTIENETRDLANTGEGAETTSLRPGLILGKLTAETGQVFRHFKNDASDGTQDACCILLEYVDVSGGSDVSAMVMWIGEAQLDKLPNYHANAVADLQAGLSATKGYIALSS